MLNIRQATVVPMEKRSDLMLSTLRSYVEAMGGKLNLVVEFPDRKPVSFAGLSQLNAAKPKKGAEPGAARPA